MSPVLSKLRIHRLVFISDVYTLFDSSSSKSSQYSVQKSRRLSSTINEQQLNSGKSVTLPARSCSPLCDNLIFVKQCVESSNSVCLDDAIVALEELSVFPERKVSRVNKAHKLMQRITSAYNPFALADVFRC